jgi:hypothetical protein
MDGAAAILLHASAMFGLFGKPSQSKFAKIVMDAARKARITHEFIADEADFSLRNKDAVFFLGNSYAEYCKPGAQKKHIVENMVAMMLAQKEEITREQALEQCVAGRAGTRTLRYPQPPRAFSEAWRTGFEPLTDWFVRTT